MVKAELSRAGDVASQHEAGDGIQRFGEGVPELLQCTQVLALAVAEITKRKLAKERGFFLDPMESL